MPPRSKTLCLIILTLLSSPPVLFSQESGTRLLREPTLSATHIAFTYGGDIWIAGREGGNASRITSTPAVESNPHFSPDGRWLAFTSTRSGSAQVWVVPSAGGDPRRLSWHPSPTFARGWTPDGSAVLYASQRGSAPVAHHRLFIHPATGGAAREVPAAMGFAGSFSNDGKRLAIDRVSRWDTEFRNYRGGQNTALTILDLTTLDEVRLPNERTTDIAPVWLNDKIWFISDRDYGSNVWSYDTSSRALVQVTHFKDADVKTLGGGGNMLAFEQDGWLYLLDPATNATRRLTIHVRGDFPWAASRWIDATRDITVASLSPTGKRALFSARGEVFTVPVENGDTRNVTHSPDAADRAAIWSPDGSRIAYITDTGAGYRLMIGPQDGLTSPRAIDIGDAKMVFNPAWSPDGRRIAFVDGRARLRVLDVNSGNLATADVDGAYIGAGEFAPAWSPDSKWLAYAKLFRNNLRRVVVWNVDSGKATPITDPLAHSISPAWDAGGRWLYFLASTNLGLGSAWANLSNSQARPTYAPYVMVLRKDDPTPFPLQSDDEAATAAAPEAKPGAKPAADKPAADSMKGKPVRIDFDGIDRRIMTLPGLPERDYTDIVGGPARVVFVSERVPNQPGVTLQRFDMEKRKVVPFVTGATNVSLSSDGKKLLYRSGQTWSVVGTDAPPAAGAGKLNVAVGMRVDPTAEWNQIFEEAWRMERDFFYDPNLHGADWKAVHARYAPLIPWVKSRADLTYILDQVGGELSVGHSFVGGGDHPAVDTVRTGLLGADLEVADGRWRLKRVFTSESWNPELRAPLDAPGVRAAAGHYLLAVDGRELRAENDPYEALDGTADRQTVLRLNDRPTMEGSWTVTVVPIRSENSLRQRAWVEDNRRKVDQLSNGRLAYVWVPNTGGPGFSSFNRYFIAQQDKEGAVIDERFNQGGLLDDYMVGLMTRKLIGGITNDIAPGNPLRLPTAGVLGPKVLLVNEMAGSGGDYFPWAFRELQVGPLIGTRTWGGLVASCVPYALIDGGTITSPCTAVYNANSEFFAEGVGVPPDIEVFVDAKSWAAGRDPQLERGIAEALKLLETRNVATPPAPKFPIKARRPGN